MFCLRSLKYLVSFNNSEVILCYLCQMEEEKVSAEINYMEDDSPYESVKLIYSVKELIMHKFEKAGYKGAFKQSGESSQFWFSISRGRVIKKALVFFTHNDIHVDITGENNDRAITIKHNRLLPYYANQLEQAEEIVGAKIDSIINLLKIEFPEIFS